MRDSEYRFVPGDEYLSLVDDTQTWIIEPLVPVGGLVNVYGAPKRGKSNFALGMALAVSTGQRAWLEFAIRQSGPVLYLQADTPRSLWKNEHLKKKAKRGCDFSNIYFADMLTIPYPFDVLEGDAQVLQEMIQALDFTPLLIIIDTIREIHGGDEDKSGLMRNVVAKVREASAPSAIVFLSHSRKGVAQEGHAPSELDTLMDDNRGSGYVAGRMDTIIKLTKKYMHYQGRAVGLQKKRIKMNDVQLWEMDTDPIVASARALLEKSPTDSTRARAKRLAEELGIDEEAARSVMRRLK